MTVPRALLAPLLAAAAGLALLASHPPVGAWPLTFVAPGLLLAALWVDDADARLTGRRPRAGRLGVLAGLSLFGPLISWLVLPAGVVGWGLLVAVQAAWLGVLALLLRPALAWRSLPLVMAAAWTGIDAWRAIWPMNGFGWGAIAYAHVDGSWLLPTARILGGRGITFLVVLIGAAAAVAIRMSLRAVRQRAEEDLEHALDRHTRIPLAFLVGGLLASVLLTVEPPAADGSLDVLAVQGNGVRHWELAEPEPDAPLRITTALRDATIAAIDADGPPDLAVWPESSVDRDPWTDRGAPLAELAGEAAAASGRLLTGASLDGPDPATQRLITALLLEDGFTEVDRYVKRRLVPFGEFIPLRPLLSWFPPLEQIPRDAQPGGEPRNLEVAPGVRAAVVICFETLFAEVVRGNVLADEAPAHVLLTLTNDASFGDSAEPAQHLAQSQLRAVETGRWVVHAALSGSSAFVSPDGDVQQRTELFTVDTIRAEVPLVAGLTPFLRVGDVVGWLGRVAVLALLAVVVRTSTGERRELQPDR
ncbi:MAG: apolipoprotein N-acyltransferase [Nitriliruptoraceae bacterium]